MSIDIIIPNYNGARLIAKNLPGVLKAHKNYNGKIIIVDDGSNNSDKNDLKKEIKKIGPSKVFLYEHKKNRGFSSAINTGVKMSNSEFIVLLNSDVLPHKDFLRSLIHKMTHDKNLFGIGCMDESIEEDKIVRRGRGIGYWHDGMILHMKGEIDRSDTFWVSGGSSIFRRNVFMELGGMDTIYNPFYWEDIDLSYRARKAGYSIEFGKSSVVKHFHDEGAIKKGFSNNKISKIAYRNQFIFIWKNITSFHLTMNHIVYLPIHFLGALKRFDVAFFEGFFLALLKLPVIISKRNSQKKMYKIPDFKLLNHIS